MQIQRVWSFISSRLNFMQNRQLRWHLHELPEPTLGVVGLPPELAACLSKNVYTLFSPPSAALKALLMYTIKNGLDKPLIWVSSRSGEDMRDAMLQFGIALEAENTKKNLTLFSLDLQRKEHAQHDIGRMLIELDRYRLATSGGLLILEGAEHLLDWDSPAALRKEIRWLSDWAEDQVGRVLWVIDPDPDTEGDMRSIAIHRMQQYLAGIVQLVTGRGELVWKMDLWKTPEGVRLGESYPLRFTHQGQLALLTPEAGETLLLALDEERVVALSGVVADERWVPEHWEIVGSLEEMLAACDKAVAATVLLDCRSVDNIEPMLRAVYQLRKSCGNKLKILVREIGQPLRYQHESLLLNVGANQVIGRDVNFSRFLSLVSGVQGQQLSRIMPPDFETAITSCLNEGESGYLTVEQFVASVKDSMSRSRLTGIVCALIKLRLWAQVSHIEALNSCSLVRAGDVCTADETSVYLFLFACQVPDIPAVLERVFSVPLDSFFEGEVRLIDETSIETFINDFEKRVADTPQADYSGVVLSSQRPAPQGRTQKRSAAKEASDGSQVAVAEAEQPSFTPESKPRQVTPYSLPMKGGPPDG